MTAVGQQLGAWLEQFTSQPQARAPWIGELREAAFRRFAELGFPTTHNEEWRFTNVAPIARTRFSHRQADMLLRFPTSVEELDPAAAESHLARYAGFEQNAFVALNTAFLNQVQVFRVPRGVVVERPIEIACQAPPEVPAGQDSAPAVHPRTLIL